jgi:hypothetical protein
MTCFHALSKGGPSAGGAEGSKDDATFTGRQCGLARLGYR